MYYGAENGELTKTLCVMLKSIGGKYQDIVSMVPIVGINADKLFSIWKNIVSHMTMIGFDIAVTMTMTDGHSSNMKLFNKILKNHPRNHSVENSDNLLFDPLNLFKIFYNNTGILKGISDVLCPMKT